MIPKTSHIFIENINNLLLNWIALGQPFSDNNIWMITLSKLPFNNFQTPFSIEWNQLEETGLAKLPKLIILFDYSNYPINNIIKLSDG